MDHSRDRLEENNIVSDYEIVFKGICEECQKEEVKNGIKG